MRRCLMGFALAGAILAVSGPAVAQDDRYDDEDDYGDRNYAFAVGAGLVAPGEEVETYLMASFRIRVGDRGGRGDDWRGRREGGIEGYIEPEIGYWEASESGLDGSDLLVGANIIGVVPFGNVDSFFGAGAGVHFIDAALLGDDAAEADDSATKLGLNTQFGLDIHLSEAWSVFGAGRFDLVQGAEDNLQAKVYLGLRAAF